MSKYFEKKARHAYTCYKENKPRQKVYAVVEKEDKFVVLKGREGAKYKYNLSGGGVEKGEDIITAIKREVLEELNIECEFVKTLGVICDKSKWEYKGKSFWVDDRMEIVYVKFLKYAKNSSYGIKGEFESQDIIAEVTKQEMLDNVAEFAKYGVKLD